MRLILAFPILFVAGCSPSTDSNTHRAVDINAAAEAGRNDVANHAATDGNASAPAALTPSPVAALPPVELPEPGTPGGLPKGGIVSEEKFTPDSAQGAANVVQTYYALLGEGKYREARALWEDAGGASGMSDAAFVANFARYSEYHAQVGAPGEIEAGAGQRYVSVPVVVYGRLKAGGVPYHASGTATLHRAGDIDGATTAQKTWHLSAITLKP